MEEAFKEPETPTLPTTTNVLYGDTVPTPKLPDIKFIPLETFNPFPTSKYPVIFASPVTCKVELGFLFPIPTFPASVANKVCPEMFIVPAPAFWISKLPVDKVPVTFAFPETWNVTFGDVAPMARLPELSILTLSVPPVVQAKVSGAGLNPPVLVSFQ